MTSWLPGLAMMLAGMAMSFLYSGCETGAYAVNKIRLELRAETGSSSARRMRALLRDFQQFLAVVLIGNNIANYLSSAGMIVLLTSLGYAHAEWWSLLLVTPAIIIFCELLPKNLFYHHAETLVYTFWPFVWVSRLAYTVTGLAPAIRGVIALTTRLAGRSLGTHESPLGTGGRLAAILEEGRASGVLSHAQSLIARRVVNIARVPVRDTMIPLERAVLVEESVSADDLRRLLREQQHPRVGVCAGRRENIVGLLNIYDVLLDEGGSPPSAHLTSPLMLPEHLNVTEALVALQQHRTAMGFVTDPQGGCIGLVTVKDLVEEIVGELEEW